MKRYPAPVHLRHLDATIYTRRTGKTSRPRFYAQYVSTDTGKRRQRSTGQTDEATAWDVVATWPDVPHLDGEPSDPSVRALVVRAPAAAGHTVALAERRSRKGAGPGVLEEPRQHDDSSADAAEPAVYHQFRDASSGDSPTNCASRALARACHERYLETGAQPTADEIAAFQAVGLWLDPDEIEAWCEANGRPLQRDWALALLLLLPTLVSLGASRTGLAMLLPVPSLATVSAVVLALMTIALSWGLVGHYARAQARQALTVLAFVSVLTGFPAYYGAIAGSAERDRGIDSARAAHAEVAARTVAVEQAKAAELEGAAAAAWTLAREEASGGVGSGRAGRGPKARALEAAAQDAERAAAAVVARASRLGEAAQVGDDAGPVELFRSSQAMWAAADPETRGDQPMRSSFVDEAQESSFFLPYERLYGLSPLALVALVLAVGLDALVIYLGMGVVRPRSSVSSVRSIAHGTSTVLADANWAKGRIERAASTGR